MSNESAPPVEFNQDPARKVNCVPPAFGDNQEHIIQFFAYQHLPERLAVVSRPFGELALLILEICPRNPERTVALRKLLEAKDAAVRAVVAKV